MANELNRDELIGINMPRGSYALSGGDWDTSVAGAGAPMIINSHTPGIHGDAWASTYGSSHDAFLSIVDGSAVETSINNVALASVYVALPNTKSDNIWETTNGRQQIQYIVSGSDIDDGRSRIDSFGPLADARGLCLRVPAMACGYGKTKEMLPLIGNARENPEFIKTNRSFWKTGSLESRWDTKRSIWATFNDLIVDHDFVGLGTAVHGSNPDDSEGFPYLKGRLQDVWWVRQPLSLDGSSGKSDGSTSAEIMTHLEHSFYDDAENASAKLSSIFIIPHNSLPDAGTPDVPHEKGEENTVGNETTGVGASIDLKSTVHFYLDAEKDGPIRMLSSLTELGQAVCCENTASKFFIGEMIFLDDQPDRCDDQPSEAGPPPNQWVPAVRIDECELMGGHIGDLVQNDINIINQLSTVCVAVNTWSKGKLQNELTGVINDLTAGIAGACGGTVQLAGAVDAALADLVGQLDVAFGAMAGAINSNIAGLLAAINVILQLCCEASAQFTPDATVITDGFVVPKINADPCPLILAVDVEFPCDPCSTVEISAPCADQDAESFTIGFNCDSSSTGTTSALPTFNDVGDCQTSGGGGK